MRAIIHSVYVNCDRYDGDTLSFFDTLEKEKLEELETARFSQIDFSPSVLNSKFYGNREKSMVELGFNQILEVKDLCVNLLNFLSFFPEQYAYELATDYRIQERIINVLCLFQ